MKKTLFVICLLISGMLFIPSAEAAPVTFNFSGSFFSQQNFPVFPGNIYDFSDATITGSYTFDSATSDGSNFPTIGLYTDTLTNLSGTVTYGGGFFSFLYGAADGDINVWNNANINNTSRDAYEVRSGGGDFVFDNDLPIFQMVAFNFSMISPNLSSIANDALPLIPPALFGAPTIGLTFTSVQGNPPGILIFRATSLTGASVPEPSTLLLLGSGLLGLVCFGRRRMKK